MSEIYTITASVSDAPDRLDRWLAAHMHDVSRSRIKALIKAGQVLINDMPVANAAASVKPGDEVQLHVPDAEPAEPQAEKIELQIIYEDDALIVVDKPAGMVVHPAPGAQSGTLVNALLYHCGDGLSGIGGVKRPGIVHRIDKDTSGLLVVAKTDVAHQRLSEQFAQHSVERRYSAFTYGHPKPAAGRVEGNIGRHPKDRKKMAVVSSGGKHAITHYETRASYWSAEGAPLAARIECRLETGRTHQVRVHMSHIRFPLIGDPVYARSRRLPNGATNSLASALAGLKRQALHAEILGFLHPVSGKFLKFASPLPHDLQQLKDALEHQSDLSA